MAAKNNTATAATATSCSSPTSATSVSSVLMQWWGVAGLRCGGCLTPTTTLRLLGTLALAFGVVVASLEGTLLVREEQRYQRCVLRRAGLVSDRLGESLSAGDDANVLSRCYLHDINLVRGCGSLGVVVAVAYVLSSLLMLVAISTERWRLCAVWGWVSVGLGLQEVLVVGLCWPLLRAGDIFLYILHILLLTYSVAVLFSVLRQVNSGGLVQRGGRRP